MRILLALYYYRPHMSGLTIYVERLAAALARRGHTVTVLTSQYDASLPREEWSDGVRIVRVPVALRVSKGVLMPALGRTASALLCEHDVLSIHLPNVDAPGLTIRGHRQNKPVILTYHCDLTLPRNPFNAHPRTGNLHGPLRRRPPRRQESSPTPTITRPIRACSRDLKTSWRSFPRPSSCRRPRRQTWPHSGPRWSADERPVIGMAGRFASEKGVEYLVAAVPRLLERFPHAKVLFAGPHKDVLGEQAYWQRLREPIAQLGAHWKFLGQLDDQRQLPHFYSACDVLVVPSLNSTESFALVQVEAMLCGTPAVVSNLPGVRQPIKMTGMGEVVEPGSAAALCEGLERVLSHRQRYVRPRREIEALFNPGRTVDAYLELFEREIARRSG